MNIGNGIAISGLWIFSGLVGSSKYVSGFGMLLAIFLAVVFTLVLS